MNSRLYLKLHCLKGVWIWINPAHDPRSRAKTVDHIGSASLQPSFMALNDGAYENQRRRNTLYDSRRADETPGPLTQGRGFPCS